VVVLLIASVGVGLLQVAATYYQEETAAIAGLRHTVAGHDSLRIYGSQGTLLYESGNLGVQRSVPLSHIPIEVINATVAIEDHDFWINQGVDFSGIARAALADLRARQPEQGASTITQQLIKQQIVGSTATYQRKLQEIILALGITTSATYSKRDILEMYLNSIAYSPLAYGIDSASQYYFGYEDDPATGMTAAQRLDLAQATMLAGIPQNPNLNDPFQHFAQARTRQRQVLDRMVTLGYITQAQAL
jgi:membrane peptidoglycan carboxypeptidase